MKKIELKIGEEIQGKFELKKLNLLLVFQVNCPGCFSYALPFFNKLFDDFDEQGISFLAMSTAFEDFDKNTIDNTKDLVKKGIVIGETKKMLEQLGYKTLPYALRFPVVMDTLQDNIDDLEEVVQKICHINPEYSSWHETEKSGLEYRVRTYLKSLKKVGLTFTLNQLKGTPSLILFNDSYEILDEWFGHVTYEYIVKRITELN